MVSDRYTDYDDGCYDVFFKAFDQKIAAATTVAISDKVLWDAVAKLPDEQLLSQGVINTLRMACFRPGVRSVPSGVPDSNGNWVQPSGGFILNSTLWSSVGKAATMWVIDLIGCVPTFGNPNRAAWDWSKPIGDSVVRATPKQGVVVSSDALLWVQSWIEPRLIVNNTAYYSIGQRYVPVVGGNEVSFDESASSGSEETPNKVAFDGTALVSLETSPGMVGFEFGVKSELKATPKMRFETNTVSELEGTPPLTKFSVPALSEKGKSTAVNLVSFSSEGTVSRS